MLCALDPPYNDCLPIAVDIGNDDAVEDNSRNARHPRPRPTPAADPLETVQLDPVTTSEREIAVPPDNNERVPDVCASSASEASIKALVSVISIAASNSSIVAFNRSSFGRLICSMLHNFGFLEFG